MYLYTSELNYGVLGASNSDYFYINTLCILDRGKNSRNDNLRYFIWKFGARVFEWFKIIRMGGGKSFHKLRQIISKEYQDLILPLFVLESILFFHKQSCKCHSSMK